VVPPAPVAAEELPPVLVLTVDVEAPPEPVPVLAVPGAPLLAFED
jgi:hypothetical protein